MRILSIFLLVSSAAACGGGNGLSDCTTTLKPGADAASTTAAISTALISAHTGDKICFEKGTYSITEALNLSVNGVTLEGVSGGGSVIDFAPQMGAADGMLVTANDFTAKSFTLKNSKKDGIVVMGGKNITFDSIKVSWDAGSVTSNGAYAIYPVTCTNVEIVNCEVVGASDAGVYVGQSNHIKVHGNKVHANVAGIEIENSQYAEVYDNETYDNTAGILVFNLPNLPVKDGRKTLVHDNDVHDNNRENFALVGNIVATVPRGLGMVIMSADEIQVTSNTIHGNETSGIAIASYLALPLGPPNDPMYDAYPETIWIHGNTYMQNGTMPQDLLLPSVTMDQTLEDIVWDGYVDTTKDNSDGHLNICVQETGGGSFRMLDAKNGFMMQSTDVTPHQCMFPPLAPVTFI